VEFAGRAQRRRRFQARTQAGGAPAGAGLPPHSKNVLRFIAAARVEGWRSKLSRNRLFPVIVALTVSWSCNAAVLTQNFATDPTQNVWRIFGDASLFVWNATNQNLEVTWDSSRTNSFFLLPLGTVLAKSDDFSFSFDLRLQDIQAGSTSGKSNEFEIAIGLLNYRTATNVNFFRGAGVSSTYGVRNVIEFDYFPDAGFGDTWGTTVISSNNVFAFGHNFPLTLSVGDLFRITLAYTAADQILRTSATKNGAAFDPLADVLLAGKPDFRVDTFAVISYSDAVQSGPPAFHGSVLAHGVVDNVVVTVPNAPPLALTLRHDNDAWRVQWQSQSNWIYALERSTTLRDWSNTLLEIPGTGGVLELTDTNAAGSSVFYRLRAERP
jgi:hypothetical protein